MRRTNVQKIEDLLGLVCCPDCGSQLQLWSKSNHIYTCKKCVSICDKKGVKFGRKMDRAAKEEVKLIHPEAYDLAFNSWKMLARDIIITAVVVGVVCIIWGRYFG